MPKQRYTSADLEKAKGAYYLRAHDDFETFRRLKRPTMKWDWFPKDITNELQHFHVDLISGKRPKVAIEAPPQHGKTETVRDFACWFSGRHPALKTIYASFSEGLGITCNRELERTMQSELFEAIFPGVRIGEPGWARNHEVIEFVGHGGSFRNTTIKGTVNGYGLDLAIIDDPHKGREEANRKSARDEVWSWFTDDFFARFADSAGLVLIMTRWHTDDLLSRIIDRFGRYSPSNPGGVRVLRYPAIAEQDSKMRRKGEALFPAHKSIEFLLERKKLMSQASWEAEYQQNPIVIGGGALPIAKLRIIPIFDRSKVTASIRYWDKAGTDDNPDAAFTAGCLMHRLKGHNPEYVIEDIRRGQWDAYDREQQIVACAKADKAVYYNYEVIVEQEPGSGGKESAENTIRRLAGFRARADRVTGSKVVRADPFVAQVQAGNVGLVAGEYVQPFKDECEPWPRGQRDDQVDAAAGAFAWVVKISSYNLNLEEWAL